MTVSHLNRSRDQLWSDLLVALGGSEAFLSRSISERRILLEIMETFSVTVSTKDIDDLDELLEQVVIAAGGTASHLRQNKHEMLAALVTALGGTPPSASSSSTGELLAACVNAADTGGGGGGVPAWVPTDAKIYIDLVNVRAWTEADGEVAIDTLLGTDANTDNAWGATSYDAGNLTADGYVSTGADTAIGFIGGSRDLVLAGASWVARFKQVIESNPGNPSLVLVSADGNNGIEIDFEPVDVTASSWGGSASLTSSKIRNSSLGAINVTAATITPLRLEFSANGSDPVDTSLTTDDYPPGDIVAALIELDNETLALQSITIYDALPSTAGLSALSATGVTNTAPTITNDPSDFTPSFAEAAAVTGSTVATITTSDAEGNPLTFSLPVNVGSKFAVGATGVVTSTEDLLAGGSPYTFTLRATDPGGLYAEQAFTITVTA